MTTGLARSVQVRLVRHAKSLDIDPNVVLAHLGTARLHVQVDVGIGDAVTPEPVWIEYPSLLDMPRPRLRAYQPETALEERSARLGIVIQGIAAFIGPVLDALAGRQPFTAKWPPSGPWMAGRAAP